MTARSLYLIDGSSYLFRAYHALPPLTNSEGVPTGAIYGFTNMLLKIIRDEHPEAMVVVFDSAGPTERHTRYADYKANRGQMPDDLSRQLPYIHRIVEAMRIPLLMQQGQEADDLIGSLARQAEAQDFHVTIVTGDKDMLQLIGPEIRVYDSMKEKVYGEPEVLERFGVPPGQVVEVMGLMGDPIDNIPGVRGIGEKTARSLIQQFGSIEEMITRLHEIKSVKVREILRSQVEQARLSRDLARLRTDLQVSVDLGQVALREPDNAALQALFRELGFTGLQRAFTPVTSRGSLRMVVIDREDEIGETVKELLDSDSVAIAVARNGSGSGDGTLYGLAFCKEPDVALCCFPEAMTDSYLERLRPVLAGEKPMKIGHDLKRIMTAIGKKGVALRGLSFDAMVASYLLNPNRSDHSLATLVFELLGVKCEQGSEAKGGNDGREMAMRRAAEEAHLVWQLKEALLPKLEQSGLLSLFKTIEMPLIEVLASMEEVGFSVDADQLGELGKELESQLSQIESRIFALAGEHFNINSPKQLADVLFQRLKLQPLKRTKTGYSTNVEVLQRLAMTHELPAEVLNYRSLAKLKSTYVDVLLRLADRAGGRIHTSFNQTVTATGRLSSSEPNLQNIPVRTEVGRRIRQAFIVSKGHRLLSADYSQIELRILAHLSQDQALIAAFTAGADVHRSTAAEIFGVQPEEVTAEMRRRAKVINFGIVYGMSPFGLASELDIPQEEAALYIDRYFQIYHGVKLFIDQTIREAGELGFVSTLWGRRRAIPELRSSDQTVRQLGERLAVNTPIQGSAADLIKVAMIAIFRRLRSERLGTRMILQIHDELLFEVPEAELEVAKQVAIEEMERAAALCIPLKVDLGVGVNWAEAHA
ncbi:MAG: DNA polymerase I [candidate division NC10 bacterium]|nr:DNA polymerase I [candidate division NC10 bacterium]MDE2321994.1 DNA polymerase I [candidate division NC10 bacterium]